MKVTACELVELDDGTAWLRIGDVMNLLKQELHVAVGAPAVTVRPTLSKGGDPFLDGLDAKCKAKPKRAAAKGDEDHLRALLREGTAVGKAAKLAGVDANRAYYLAAKWKKEPQPVEVDEPTPMRRCPECRQKTATDPCQHCGERIAPRGKAA